mmetsp:Transcript_124406/g.229189  ORF Transcript_124406/g.229189 Transcript_124406/m.229189 type:complete len:685 (-) Transcript_124406:21-2075(-)
MSENDGFEPGEIVAPAGGRRSDRRRSNNSPRRSSQKKKKSGAREGGVIVRGNPSWNEATKWEEMEADLMEVAVDLNDAPNMKFREGDSLKPTPPALPPDPASPEEYQETEKNFKSLEEFFDSQDYARLRESDDWPSPGKEPLQQRSHGRGKDPGFQPMQAIDEGASSRSKAHSGRESNRSNSGRSPKGRDFSSWGAEAPKSPWPGSPDKPKSPAQDNALAPPPPARPPPALDGASPKRAASCEVGSKVRIFGLTGREDLNGQVGEVMEWAAERGRWRVQIPGQKNTVSVRPENLSILEETQTPSTKVPTKENTEEPGEIDEEQNAGQGFAQDDLSAKFLVPEEPDDAPVLAYDPDLRLAASEDQPQAPGAAPVAEVEDTRDVEQGNGNEGAVTPDDEIHNLPVKGIRFMWRLWRILVLLSLFEFALVAASACLDLFWSPCRQKLDRCLSLGEDDCSGDSCKSGAPLWAPAWPLASLVSTAIPLRQVLLYAADFSPEEGSPLARFLWIAVPLTLAVVAGGATSLLEMFTAGMHYASRCPMERSAGQCEADICSTPPCRRVDDLSPCQCGEEAEMARALFLEGLKSCHPNEWLPQQMTALEELIDDYENFACVFGPLICTALAIGVVLILVQLLSCPLLLFGRWGVHQAVSLLFKPEEQRGPMVQAPASKERLPAPEQVPPQSRAV